MDQITVFFIDGSSQVFDHSGMHINDGQFWLEITNNYGNTISFIPREQIKYVITNLVNVLG